MKELKQKWNALDPKERRSVSWMLGGFAVFLVWFLIIQPAFSYHSEQKEQYESRQALFTWLSEVAPQARRAVQLDPDRSGSSTAEDSGNLSSQVVAAAKAQSIQLQRFENDGNDGLRIWMDGVNFDAAVRMLISLEQQGITADQLNIDSNKKPGDVDIRGVLRRQS